MKVSVLIPTYNRLSALIATLTALTAQTYSDYEVIVADQSDVFAGNDTIVCTLQRLFELHGNSFKILYNLPKKGIAQQRQFLLDESKSDYSFFLDDDILLEPDVLERMVKALTEEQAGFVGMALIGLSFLNDIRPQQHGIEFWEGKIEPEIIQPGTLKWERYVLHNAANIFHIGTQLNIKSYAQRKYKIAWVGGCILYDTKKLRDIGGFSFWDQLPEKHCGEDVLVQLKLMAKYGGFGIIPSGAYHLELPTTIPNREVNAPEHLQATI